MSGVLSYSALLQASMPPVAYDATQPNLAIELTAEAQTLGAVDVRLKDLLVAMLPNSGETLEDWERVYGLPCDCLATAPLTRAQRLRLLIAKINEGGTFTKQKAIEIAATIGYTITINEQRARGYAGGYGLPYMGLQWNFVWDVITTNNTVQARQYGDEYGFGYQEWGNEVLECIIKSKAQADTLVRFIYL